MSVGEGGSAIADVAPQNATTAATGTLNKRNSPRATATRITASVQNPRIYLPCQRLIRIAFRDGRSLVLVHCGVAYSSPRSSASVDVRAYSTWPNVSISSG